MNEENENYFIAKYVAGACETDDLINYANCKLDNGVYSDGLLDIIDAELKCWGIVSSLFEKLIDQLPSFEDSINLIIKYHLKLIASEKIDPFIQFRQLLDDINNFDLHENVTKYVGDSVGIEHLYGLYYARDDLDLNDNDGVVEIGVLMQEESKKWLSEH
ncbi:hypothetical protein [Pseudoalteromonas agarivorans]|uniref:Uncharacterized protein n=1 Tax=Pseudoalteromonas agarivorans TaxID=176102 RepID=A0AAD0TYX7_9GAMM|nr:hypothetical protein [Pseudoalteromonas agarivorans]AYM86611.1 hypothetical protein D9T18_07770 [Pseudoalteromonas agarivorans]